MTVVSFVGAGPGDKELITRVSAVSDADRIYAVLVNPSWITANQKQKN